MSAGRFAGEAAIVTGAGGGTGNGDQPLLELRDVSVHFGGITALDAVSMTVRPGAVHGVIGPNGAGKTTLFNVVCGFVAPAAGVLMWRGEPLSSIRPHQLAGLGIARTLQGLGLFERMTVLENVVVGADRHGRSGFLSALLGAGPGLRSERALTGRARSVLEELGVEQYESRYPESLPYPVRKRVSLARALASEPDLLLLDEPASGLSSEEMGEFGGLVSGLSERMAVVLVEHHMDLVMSVCDRITALDFGRVIADGSAEQVRRDPAVQAAYLGDEVTGHESGASSNPVEAG